MACLMTIALMENPHPHPELVFSVVGSQHVAPLWQFMDECRLEKLGNVTYFSEFNVITLCFLTCTLRKTCGFGGVFSISCENVKNAMSLSDFYDNTFLISFENVGFVDSSDCVFWVCFRYVLGMF